MGFITIYQKNKLKEKIKRESYFDSPDLTDFATEHYDKNIKRRCLEKNIGSNMKIVGDVSSRKTAKYNKFFGNYRV